MSEKELSEEARKEAYELVNEAVNKFVNGIIGIEKLFGIQVDEFEWVIKRAGQTYQHKIYYEREPFGGTNESKN